MCGTPDGGSYRPEPRGNRHVSKDAASAGKVTYSVVEWVFAFLFVSSSGATFSCIEIIFKAFSPTKLSILLWGRPRNFNVFSPSVHPVLIICVPRMARRLVEYLDPSRPAWIFLLGVLHYCNFPHVHKTIYTDVTIFYVLTPRHPRAQTLFLIPRLQIRVFRLDPFWE